MMRLRRFTANIVIPQAPLLWSDPATWGGAVPATGDVTIPAGRIVILDVMAPATLGCIIIPKGATLQLASTGTIGFAGVDCIQVFGSFLGGSAGTPLTNPVSIVLQGVDPVWPAHSTIPHINDNGNPMYRSLMTMAGGVTSLIAAHPTYKRMFLGDHAASGSSTIVMASAPGWAAGDEIVISPSGFFNTARRAEKRTIVAISGTTITLNTPLGYARWGKLQYPVDATYGTSGVSMTAGTWTKGRTGMPSVIDERAVVIHLTRNFNMSGVTDVNWSADMSGTPTRVAADGQGMHMMCMSGGKAYYEGIRIKRGGQAGRMGRYPFHWHMQSWFPATYNISTTVFSGGGGVTANDTSGQGATGCVVDGSANRAYVTHGTNGIPNTDCIAYNIDGWAFFLEDGSEQGNTWTRPSVVTVNDPGSINRLKVFDAFSGYVDEQSLGTGPGGYWVTNMANTLQDALACDCIGKGMLNSTNLTCLGLSTTVPLKPSAIHPGAYVHDGHILFSNGQQNLMTGGQAVDDFGNFPTNGPTNYRPTDNGDYDTSAGGTGNSISFTISNVKTHHSGALSYQNFVGKPRYLNWSSSSHPCVHAIGQVDNGVFDTCLFTGYTNHYDTFLGYGNALNTGFGPPNGTTYTTMHAIVSYHRGGFPANTTFLNFPYQGRESTIPVPGTATSDQALWMGSGATRTQDLYLEPMQQGLNRSPGLQFVNAHPGFRAQSSNVDGRAFTPTTNDHRAWNTSGGEWDPYGYWSTAGNYLLQDSTFMTYGASGLTAVLPLSDHQGYSTPDHVYGFVAAAIDTQQNVGGNGYGSTTKDVAVRNEPITWNVLDTSNVVQGTWVSPTAVGMTPAPVRQFRHAALRLNQRYMIKFDNYPTLSVFAGFSLTNFWRTTDTVIVGIGWLGTVAARAMFANGPQGPDSSATNISSYWIPTGQGAAADSVTYAANTVASMAALVASTGKPITMWQDTTNNLVWVKLIGGLLTQSAYTTNFIASDPLANESMWKYHTLTIIPKP